MFSKSLFFSQSIAVVAAASIAFGATPVIGLVTASGHFTVERSRVWGNSTLFDGVMVETDAASSQLALSSGAKVQLGAESRARVWSNRVQLEKGVGQLAAAGAYELDAAGLKIMSGESQGRLRVAVGERIEVAAISGNARVSSASGLLLATIPAGRTMAFAPQAGAAGVVTRTGCLLYKDGHYILQDDNTQEVLEVNGRDLAAALGNRVQVTGTAAATKPTVSIATLVMNETGLTTQGQGGCLSAATALNAQTQLPANAGRAAAPSTVPNAPKASGGGMSTGAKVAIVAVVAGGGAGAAIALAGKKKSTSN